MSHDQGASAPSLFLVPYEETKIMREVFWEQLNGSAKDAQPFSHAWGEMLKHKETPCREVKPVGWMTYSKAELALDEYRQFTVYPQIAQVWRDMGREVKEVYA
jgi:hypothetical protein